MKWRTGRSVGRTIYMNDQLVGMMDIPELAADKDLINEIDLLKLLGLPPE